MKLDQFFKEFSVPDSEINPETTYTMSVLDAFAHASGHSFYVVDYNRRGFAYVSSNPHFLCGYKVEEVIAMGYHFYEKVMDEEDLEILLEANRKGFELFYSLPVEPRVQLTISCDFQLHYTNKRKIMVNHQLTPILLTPSGKIWMALCLVNLSTREEPGNMLIRMNGLLHHSAYSFVNQRWQDSETLVLTEREREVLQLSAQGYANEEIGKMLFINVNTVKYHKRKLFQKLNVRNISEAIALARNSWLF